jgi:hypothetical protein
VAHFEKIAAVASAKEAWEILEKTYAGGDKLKKVKLQTLRRRYELLQMTESESVGDFFTRILSITNLMKGYGENFTDNMLVEKVLRTLSPRFDYIVVSIEESKDLATMSVQELQRSLEAHERTLN